MSSNYPFLGVLMLSPASRPGLLGTAVAPALIGCNECVSCALPWSLLLCSQICPSVCSQLLFCFSFPVVQPEGLYLKVATKLFFTSQLQNRESHNHVHKVPRVMATCNIASLIVSLLLLSTKPNNVFAFCAINAFKLTDMRSHSMVSGVLTMLKL